MAHLAEITHWPEFATMETDLRAAYTGGYAEAAKEAALKRARELGENDRKAGKGRVHKKDMEQCPEYQTIWRELSAAYDAAYGGSAE
jgi:hypothetical protein